MHLLLLSGDLVETHDVLPRPLLIANQRVGLALSAPKVAIGRGDLALQAHDLLQLFPRRIAQGLILDVAQQHVGRQVRDPECLVVDPLLDYRKFLGRAWSELHFEAPCRRRGLGGLALQ